MSYAAALAFKAEEQNKWLGNRIVVGREFAMGPNEGSPCGGAIFIFNLT